LKPNPAIFCFTVDDVGLDGYSSVPHMRRLLDFCAEQKVSATLFTVPLAQNRPLSARPEDAAILRDAVAEGHEVGQHGLEHDRFEFGVPPPMVLSLPHEGPARERLRTSRAAIDSNLRVELIRKRLCRGRDILRGAIDRPIDSFRGPCLSICDNLFHALNAEGYACDSSRHLQPGAWDLLTKGECVPAEFARHDFDSLQYPGALRTLPLTGEYTWYLKRAMFDATLALARHDFDACLAADIPFVPICHVSPIQQGDPGLGFALYERLFAYARERAAAAGVELRLLTLSHACQSATWLWPPRRQPSSES